VIEIRALREHDNRGAFRSGDADLDRFLQQDAVAFYTKYGFLAVEPVEGGSDARPAPTPLFLSTRAIRAAMNAPLKRR
jgi:hypothetical protein